MEAAIRDRLNGCAIGAAIGDALGMPFEFGPPHPLSALVREMLPGRIPPGRFTDDTEMALAVAESLLVHRPLQADDLVKRFLKWMRSSPSDVGAHTAMVLGWISKGMSWQEASERVLHDMPATAGNGSVMRCWPVAIVWWKDREQLVTDSETQSQVTHPNPECLGGSVFINWMIAEMVAGATPCAAYESALEAVDLGEEFRQVVSNAPNCRREELKNSGWVRHTLESALWALLNTGSFEEAVVQVVNLGGDTDTAGSVTGAMAGAAYGMGAIPQRWIEKLNGEWPLGSGKYWDAKNFVRLVGRLTADVP